MKKNSISGLRTILIYGMTQQQRIDFIKRKDSSYSETNLSKFSDKQITKIAITIDKKMQADRQLKIKNSANTKTEFK